MRPIKIKNLVSLLITPSFVFAASLPDKSHIDCSGKFAKFVISGSTTINCDGNLAVNGSFDTNGSKLPASHTGGINTLAYATQNAAIFNAIFFSTSPLNNVLNTSTLSRDVSGVGSVISNTGNWANISLSGIKTSDLEAVDRTMTKQPPEITIHNLDAGNVSIVSHGNIDSNGVGITVTDHSNIASNPNVVNPDHDWAILNFLSSKFTFLMENSDAEMGEGAGDDKSVVTLSDWTTEGNFTAVKYDLPGGLPALTDLGPKNRGLNFFAGGPDNAQSSATRYVDVSALADGIDRKGVIFKLSGYFGGLKSQNDNAVLTAIFKDADGQELNTVTVGGVLAEDRHDKTGLLYRKMSGLIPSKTRSIQLTLTMTRLYGVYNDGYADNLSLSISGSSNLVCPLIKSEGKNEKNCKQLDALLANNIH